jgi:methionyl-tRNA synthetase
LAEKYGIEKTTNKLIKKLKQKEIENHFEKFEVDKALNEIFAFIDVCNEYVQDKKPWQTEDKNVLYELVESLREIAKLLSPFIPETAEKISKIFKTDKIKKAPILFEKIEVAKEKVNKSSNVKEIMEGIGSAEFADWEKLDLRVAEVENVEDIKGADKLYKLTLSLGKLGTRTVCAGIKQFYSHEDLKGMKLILFSNLKPRKLKGIESQGMILAASNEDHSKVVLISPASSDIENGARIG